MAKPKSQVCWLEIQPQALSHKWSLFWTPSPHGRQHPLGSRLDTERIMCNTGSRAGGIGFAFSQTAFQDN